MRPDPEAWIAIPNKKVKLTRDDEVITYISRNLEPYRGFHVFMRALPALLKARPNAHVVIVGGDGVSYGKRLATGTYREKYGAELGSAIDTSRVHFVGKLPYGTFLRCLQVSTAHVYLTYPFVLSWSMMEAMACGCAIVGSRTPPVEEVIEHETNGLLVDFFSPAQLVDAVTRICEDPTRMRAMREQARRTVQERYDLHAICLPQQVRLLEGHGACAPIGSTPVKSTSACS